MRPLIALALVAITLAALPPAHAAPLTAVAAPALKWAYGGCQPAPHYCDTGWYASPAVADLDGDGKAEVLWGNYELFALNGESGSTQWGAPSGGRIWPGVAVADIDKNGDLEVVVGRGDGTVIAYSHTGGVQWSRNPFGGREVRSLAVEDLDGDGPLEVVAGRAYQGATEQIHVYEANGATRQGWPARRSGEDGNGWGMYNENLAIADLDGNGAMEIYAPTDTHYITALRPNGDQIPASPIYGPGEVWSEVGVHVLQEIDLQGFADCFEDPPAPLARRLRPNFANVAPASGDLDGDGTRELVVPGDVYDCDRGDPAGDLYYLPWVLRGDRTRWKTPAHDWTVLPAPEPGSGPLSQDYTLIENIAVNTVLADLDGDGQREILFPSYDGRLHAYWLDKTQHGSWPFDVPGAGIRFASEPAVADLDNDGRAEVLLTSWPESSGGQVGQLLILDYQGNLLRAVDLPAPGEGADWNGGLGAPTIANLDADADLEVVVGTSHSGAVAYDLPGSAGARVLWGTGRGSYGRTGAAPAAPPALLLSSPRPSIVTPGGASVSFTVRVEGASGPVSLALGPVRGPAPLPTAQVTPGSLGGPGQATVTLTGAGAPPALGPGLYTVTVTATSSLATRALTLRAYVGGTSTRLPLVRR